MSVAIQDLYLEHVWVLYPGNQEYPLDGKISVIPAASLPILTEKVRKGAKRCQDQPQRELKLYELYLSRPSGHS
jgi:hypothetical protein